MVTFQDPPSWLRLINCFFYQSQTAKFYCSTKVYKAIAAEHLNISWMSFKDFATPSFFHQELEAFFLIRLKKTYE